MADAHKNFAYSLVATAPSPASSGTSLVVTAADGTKFPAVPFNATVWPVGVIPTTANAEIVRVTGIATDTLTITRAQEGTAARTILVGDQIAATITAKTLTDVETQAVDTFGAPTDVTTNNATAAAHGFLKKLTGSSGAWMGSDGNWTSPFDAFPYWSQVATITTTGNIDDQASYPYLRWNGASTGTLRGAIPSNGVSAGDFMYVENVSSQNLTIAHQNTGEATANRRIICPDAADFTLAPGGVILLIYDVTTTRWRVVGTTTYSSVASTLGTASAGTAGALPARGDHVHPKPTEAELNLSDVTTIDSSTSKHGFLKKLSNSATDFMDGTGAWDTIKDSDLSTSDITINDASTSKHGFLKKLDNTATHYMDGTGAWSTPTPAMAGDVTGTTAAAVVKQASLDFALTGDITPTQLSADQDNYAPTGNTTASVWRLSADSGVANTSRRAITGISGGTDGRLLLLVNVGSNDIWLKNANTSSTAANRFAFEDDLTVLPNCGVLLIYDNTQTRWVCIAEYQPGCKIETFTAASSTWIKSLGAKMVQVIVYGGGGSGAGGASASSPAGGTGGGGGARNEARFTATDISTTTVTVTVAQAKTGGSAGTSGTAGDPTTFGSYLKAFGGGAGFYGNFAGAASGGGGGGWYSVGTNGASGGSDVAGGRPNGGTSSQSDTNGGAGGAGGRTNISGVAEYGGGGGGGHAASGTDTGAPGMPSIFGGGGGACGCSATAGGTTAIGGDSGYINTGGAAGTGTLGLPGGNGTAGTSFAGGGGGGGGAYGSGAVAGAGGNGGICGGGGGGGGRGATAGGAGGNGGAGKCWVITYF